MRGTIPSGMATPVHTHPDPETFIQSSGEIEALATNKGFVWVKPRTQEMASHFLETAERHGHWTGTPEDNAMIGIKLPRPRR